MVYLNISFTDVNDNRLPNDINVTFQTDTNTSTELNLKRVDHITSNALIYTIDTDEEGVKIKKENVQGNAVTGQCADKETVIDLSLSSTATTSPSSDFDLDEYTSMSSRSENDLIIASIVAQIYDGVKLKRLLDQRWSGHLATIEAIIKSFSDLEDMLVYSSKSKSLDGDVVALEIGFFSLQAALGNLYQDHLASLRLVHFYFA
ncbi:hypothetical protein Btru_076231 [Bulinus truncatus]|nr:hypothetical protein Btru_076231 [Bulinus truncatus]